MTTQTTEQAIAEVWQLFREIADRFKETDAKFKETDDRFKETDARLDQRFAETDARLDQRFAETDARLDQRFAETDAKIAQTTASIHKLDGRFGNQWGRLLEALVKPGVLKLFQDRGHQVSRIHQRSESQLNGSDMEIDLTLANTNEVIPVEVKSMLRQNDVDDFLADLAEFTRFFPEYRSYRVYGAVAGLDIAREVGRYAYRKGLFVISITGDDLVEILNDEKFKPKDFSSSK